MKLKSTILILTGLFISTSVWADKPAYRIFNAKGKKATYKELLKNAANSQVVFFGELHNNPICHWLELELGQIGPGVEHLAHLACRAVVEVVDARCLWRVAVDDESCAVVSRGQKPIVALDLCIQ